MKLMIELATLEIARCLVEATSLREEKKRLDARMISRSANLEGVGIIDNTDQMLFMTASSSAIMRAVELEERARALMLEIEAVHRDRK